MYTSTVNRFKGSFGEKMGEWIRKGYLQLRLGDADWENRFFLLSAGGDLLCLPSSNSILRDAEGVINVREMTHLGVGGSSKTVLHILTIDEQGERQSYHLLADSAELAQQWLDSIQKICNKFQVQVSPAPVNGLEITGKANVVETADVSATSSSATTRYEQDLIECECRFPSVTDVLAIFVKGSDLVRDVKDRLVMKMDDEEHGASDYTLEMEGMAVDASTTSKARMCEHKAIQIAVETKTVVSLRLVLISNLNTKQKQKSIPHLPQALPLLSKMYLHVRIIQCWLNDEAIEKTKIQQYVNVVASIYHGGERLGLSFELSTAFVPHCINPQWNQLLTFPILVTDLPEVSSLNFSVYVGHQRDQLIHSKLVGWENYHFTDDVGIVDRKPKCIRLWKEHPFYSCGTVPENVSDDYGGVLCIALDECMSPWNLRERDEDKGKSLFANDMALTPSSVEEKVITASVENYDVFSVPTEEQRMLYWKYRYFLTAKDNTLSRFMQAVPWHNYAYAAEARRLLRMWTPVKLHIALQLLGPQFGDPSVRDFGVGKLDSLSNEDICSLLVQLVQCLQYEPRQESRLLMLLMHRASSDVNFAHYLYWQIKASIQVPFFSVKLKFAMSKFKMTCDNKQIHAIEKQEMLVSALTSVALAIRKLKDEDERKRIFPSLLSKLECFDSVCLPVDPSYEVNGLIISECKFMDSKKVPLWLVFKTVNVCTQHIFVIFKTGDDLRQDVLTLQMFSFMNKLQQIWVEDGMNLEMSVYKCVATGIDSGMLQVVRNAHTLSTICKVAGGGIAVFKEDTLVNWLWKQHDGDGDYYAAVENFKKSTAAYSVATCVLGIGDRHNDNIMMKRTGQLFHIDFGHILGHFKSKFGIQRERAFFVMTPDMALVMGGSHHVRFKEFEVLCGRAFNKLRANASELLVMISLMISSGLAEVAEPCDVGYMQEMLLLKVEDDVAAAKQFIKWLHQSLNAKSTQINHAIHTFVH